MSILPCFYTPTCRFPDAAVKKTYFKFSYLGIRIVVTLAAIHVAGKGEAASGSRRQADFRAGEFDALRPCPVDPDGDHGFRTADATAPAAAPTEKAPDEGEIRLHNDFGWLGRYRDANAKVTGPVTIVFMGDSITQGWFDKMPGFFTPGRIGRGIGGQTTTQMLLRFRQDVIDLKPQLVQIMAGTNDIAGNTGPMTPEQTEANIMSMAELARAHGIRVILASIRPPIISLGGPASTPRRGSQY